MKRILFAALLCTVALPAQAGPVLGALPVIFGGAGFGAVTSVFGFAAGTFGYSAAMFGLRLAGSMLLSAAARALGPKPPGAPDLIRELQAPSSLPPKRALYGRCRIYGSPIWRVKGSILYGALILNSRPSHAVTAVLFDKRDAQFTGDLYDFDGAGAVPGSGDLLGGHVRMWVGLGDQTSPPDLILSEAPDLFEASDAGRGLTVLWLRLDAGGNGDRQNRWPRSPPEVEVEGQWSRVWDMRDPLQDPHDAETWSWSENQALCALDAARHNPIRQYPLDQIQIDTFAAAADIADQPVALKAGGTEPRYRVGGGIVYSGGEVMDQITPLFEAGAAEPVRIGGRLAIAPGAYTAPIYTVADILDAEGLSYQTLKPGRDLATTIRCTFTDPARDWQSSALSDYTVPGAQAADGGALTVVDLDLPLVTSATQGMRVQKIRAHRQRAQRTIGSVLPPSAFCLVAGANAAVEFPAPYGALNGAYRVTSANPGVFAADEAAGGEVAMRVPVQLEEISAADFAWDAATDEQERVVVPLDASRGPIPPPGAITSTSGAETVSGDIVRILFAFLPSPSASALSYDWEFMVLPPEVTVTYWEAGGTIDAEIRNGAGRVFGYLAPVVAGMAYRVRVRVRSTRGLSDWVEGAVIVASAGSNLAPAPIPIEAEGLIDSIDVAFLAPNSGYYSGMEIWVAHVDDPGSATLLAGPIYGSANAAVEVSEVGLGPGVTRYYFARSVDIYSNRSPYSTVISATTLP